MNPEERQEYTDLLKDVKDLKARVSELENAGKPQVPDLKSEQPADENAEHTLSIAGEAAPQ